MILLCRVLVVVLLLATVSSALCVYPHQLAYFNEIAGGPEYGYKHLLHSNFGWGQDLLLLQQKLEERAKLGGGPVTLDARLFYNPSDLGIHCVHSTGLPGEKAIRPIGFDATTLFEGAANPKSSEQARCSEFSRLSPSFRAGYTIWVYE